MSISSRTFGVVALGVALSLPVLARAQEVAAPAPDVPTLIEQARTFLTQGRNEDAISALIRAVDMLKRETSVARMQGVVPAARPLDMPFRVGGNIPPPTRIKNVAPVYPREAREAKVQGRVIVEATINESGNVADIKVLRGVPGLDQAAVDAVSQWKYTPTTVNGEAKPIIMTVTVDFTLD